MIEIGRVRERARRIVDADGALVVPGLIALLPTDAVAEYNRNRQHHLAPGVTTTIEEIPQSVGIDEVAHFLQRSSAGPRLVNQGFLVSHNAARQQVMGNKIRDQLPPSAGDLEQMSDLLAKGLLAGAVGLMSTLPGGPDELGSVLRKSMQHVEQQIETETTTTLVLHAQDLDPGELLEVARFLTRTERVAHVIVTTNEVLDDDRIISALHPQPGQDNLTELLQQPTVIAGPGLNPLVLLHTIDASLLPVQTLSLRWARSARSFGLNDRGVIAVDRRADLNVLDHVHLADDLSDGVVSTIVAGEEIVSFNELTGAAPGRVVSRS